MSLISGPHSPRPNRLVAYASPVALPNRRKARYWIGRAHPWPGGLRTRLPTHKISRTHRIIRSLLTSASCSHCSSLPVKGFALTLPMRTSIPPSMSPSLRRQTAESANRNSDEAKVSAGLCVRSVGSLLITPEGALLWNLAASASVEDEAADTPMDQSLTDRTADAFSRGSGAELLFLGAALVGTPLPAVLGFFRDFGQKLVSAVCSLPDVESQRGAIRVSPPPLAAWVAAAPPMAGLDLVIAYDRPSAFRRLQRSGGSVRHRSGITCEDITDPVGGQASEKASPNPRASQSQQAHSRRVRSRAAGGRPQDFAQASEVVPPPGPSLSRESGLPHPSQVPTLC